MKGVDLREEWADLLERRAGLEEALASYGQIIDVWARWSSPRPAPLGWDVEQCRRCWRRGVPLIVEAPPSLAADDVEDVLAGVMEALSAFGEGVRTALTRFADAWDRGDIGAGDLLPARGRFGSATLAQAEILPPEIVAFLASAALRPFLAQYFEGCADPLDQDVWTLGVCPLCGGPPAFADIIEDGRRRLACHACGGAWIFRRLACPFCSTDTSQDLVRLEPETADQGYVVHACHRCQAYLKELDRRVRWNGRSALVEDWGSPHLDLVAVRAGFWRPVPSIVELAGRA